MAEFDDGYTHRMWACCHSCTVVAAAGTVGMAAAEVARAGRVVVAAVAAEERVVAAARDADSDLG